MIPSQPQAQAQNKFDRLLNILMSMRVPFLGTYKLVYILWFVNGLMCLQALALGKPNGIAFLMGVVGSYMQLHFLIFISSKSIATRCPRRWEGPIRMFGQRSVVLNLSVIALCCCSEGSIKFKIFLGFVAALNETVYIFWQFIPSHTKLIELWNGIFAAIFLIAVTGFIALWTVIAIFSFPFSFLVMGIKIFVPLALSLPYIAIIEGLVKCYDRDCNCRTETPLPLRSGSSDEVVVPFTYARSYLPHEKVEILNQEMSFWPALASMVFSIVALAFLSMTSGPAIEEFSEGVYSRSSGPLIILFLLVRVFRQITSFTPECMPNHVYFIRLTFQCLLGILTTLVIVCIPIDSSLFGPSTGQFIYVACMLWWEAHDAFYKFYTCRDPTGWGSYVITSCLLVSWTMLLGVWE